MNPARRHRRPTALLLLLVVLLQGLLGAAEAGLLGTSPMDEAGHHADSSIELAASHATAPDHGGDTFYNSIFNDNSNTNDSGLNGDGCDHCCQCHGHCSHFAALQRPGNEPALAPRFTLPTHNRQHTSLPLPLPDRPPIA
ncbi:hypothetical protein [Parahaliea mediterranea]|uniref:hypothetical protein n=1 Tax=Parahaliea mediterranea TaxID=651086 RepID=UPI000E2E8057|nr:hypothetical protein [Parahaliea mediterranea]